MYKKLLILSILVCVAGLGHQLYMTENSNATPAGARARLSETLVQPSTASASLAKQVAPPETMQITVPKWATLEVEYQRATSLRAFFYDATRRPEQGGYFYALGILSTCKIPPIREQIKLSGSQQDAATRLRSRCDFTVQDLEDAERALDGIREFSARDDLLLSIMVDSARARDNAAEAAALNRAIEIGNPSIIGALITDQLTKTVAKSFDRDPAADAYARHALDLVECNIGAKCDAHSIRAMTLCTQNGWCHGGVIESIQGGMGEKYAQLSTIAAGFSDNIRRKNIAALVPKKQRFIGSP